LIVTRAAGPQPRAGTRTFPRVSSSGWVQACVTRRPWGWTRQDRDMSEQPYSAPPLAARDWLARTARGEIVAGVGAALGRATRTDPVLWRVVLAVLVCFAGPGALIYLLVWLLAPEEGDTGSPLESLLGRGRSSTSPALTGLLGIVVVGLLSVI